MKYLDVYKSLQLKNVPMVTIGDQKLPIGSVVNIIRDCLGLDTLENIQNDRTIDRFDMFNIISGLIGGQNYLSQWYYKYPAITASLCLMMPQSIGQDVKLKDLKNLIYPYSRLIEDQNRVYIGEVEDLGYRFNTLSSMQKLSTALPKPIDREIDRIQYDKVSRFKAGAKTPHAIGQHVNLCSLGDRYTIAVEHSDRFKVIQLELRFDTPNNRYFKKGIMTIARIYIRSFDRHTGEIKRNAIGRLIINSDRVLRFNIGVTPDQLFQCIDPEIAGYLLSLLGFRRSKWSIDHIFISTNIPFVSPLKDIQIWNNLGFKVMPISSTIKVIEYRDNKALSEIPIIEKIGKEDPIVRY